MTLFKSLGVHLSTSTRNTLSTRNTFWDPYNPPLQIPVARAGSFVRKLPGGTQSHLINADDGCAYAVKFANNPQHRRVLVNELLAARLLEHLDLATPGMALVHTDPAFLAANRDVWVQVKERRTPPETGWHFGSRFLGDPSGPALREFIPDVPFDRIENRREFAGILAFDKWVGNQDARQCLFVPLPADEHNEQLGRLRAVWIDNGYAFGGPQWVLVESPRFGLYHSPGSSQRLRTWDDFEPWIESIRHFPEAVLEDAVSEVPREWLDGDDYNLLVRMGERLLRRRGKLADSISRAIEHSPNLFPNWTRSVSIRAPQVFNKACITNSA